MQAIPLTPTPSQSLAVLLGGQNVGVVLRQRSNGLYADIALNGRTILVGVICQDRTLLVGRSYHGMKGDLVFVDQYGKTDSNPTYDGLGSRYVLYWIEPGETIP
ncbi:hypothetical protein ACI01nite_26710 [Acetobacter cibinongensis]|uniref:Cyanophage baseplate Pam3 plug gp18 domain-containing protein n=1 Tax=Acetobacter cibinongensis TaxID=146475 RepID=A0A0D6N689_9PROT|nr:hypothetical protein [Acetobacter cibinongensis]GAN61542.1 hypothetical protein Abci_036_009 [Acetobacter cibinongensis]GBQ14446.1 hypothetical protein AA0482_0912 [Acetobacter cibinongensis NRIC 0482]GEL60069.1 hypothetical protein ACI01nite_26710 [Acetobacter cibinongensis]